ncbi:MULTISPECIES: TPR repeat region-containing protein [Nocardiopsis]|uniref:TPR repeat region-containing protein n=1 Tax=Nocardiopsis TaxID=2013 RepID=UPI001181298C|nr:MULTISPECIES: hypothetical protein [Nocardiopsis]
MSALSYIECEIDRGTVASARDTFEELFSLISGRSVEYNTITTSVGFEFSDLIGESLRGAANENQFAWSSSMLACIHAYGVLEKISTDVKWYEDRIEEIKENLSTALANSAEPDNLNISQRIIESHNFQAEEAWRDLETRCDEIQERLKEGPTPENIRALADGGYFGANENIGFYTTGDFEYYHVDEGQAEVIATHIGEAVLNGNEVSIDALENNPEYLALISAVVTRGLTAQQNGEKLLGGEVEFMETLFGDLDAASGNSSFLTFANQVSSSEHISDSLREELNRALSNTMLVLSDEDIGGGMEYLPQDVQDTAFGDKVDMFGMQDEGDIDAQVSEHDSWRDSFSVLGDFLSHSGPGMKGGTEFSTALLASSAADLIHGEAWSNPTDGEYLQSIIEIASRNPEANNIIITGEDFEGSEYQYHPNHEHLTHERIIETLYTHSWPDDGAAVSGITDWMGEQADGDEVEQERAGEAMVALMEIFSDPSFSDALSGTGHSVEGQVTNPDGTVVDMEWDNVSAGHLNPELAWAWSDLFSSYIDDFASGYGTNSGSSGVPEGQDQTRWDPDHGLLLVPSDRADFIQQIMGDGNAASRVYAETMAFGQDKMYEYIEGRSSVADELSLGGAEEAGILRGLIDTALEEEAATRTVNDGKDADYKNRVTGYGADMFGAAISEMPFAGSSVLSEGIKIGIKEGFDIESYEAEEREENNRGEWEAEDDFMLAALRGIAHDDESVMEGLRENIYSPVVEDERGNSYIPADTAQWNVSPGEQGTAIANGWSEIINNSWGSSEFSTGQAMEQYIDEYNRGRGEMNEDSVKSDSDEENPDD